MKVGNIDIGVRINETQYYRTYLGTLNHTQPIIAKVSKSLEYDELSVNEADWFTKMYAFAKELEKTSKDYIKSFAKIEASFIEPSQGNRRVNVFSVPGVEIQKLIPLSEIRDKIVIDPGTSAWIMENLLNFYRFFELQPKWDIPFVEYPAFSLDDYLIEPKEQRLIYYNYSGKNLELSSCKYVEAIASSVQEWCGTKIEQYQTSGDRSHWFNSPSLKEQANAEFDYLSALEDIASGWCSSCSDALKQLHEKTDAGWMSRKHPFMYGQPGEKTIYHKIDDKTSTQ